MSQYDYTEAPFVILGDRMLKVEDCRVTCRIPDICKLEGCRRAHAMVRDTGSDAFMVGARATINEALKRDPHMALKAFPSRRRQRRRAAKLLKQGKRYDE